MKTGYKSGANEKSDRRKGKEAWSRDVHLCMQTLAEILKENRNEQCIRDGGGRN